MTRSRSTDIDSHRKDNALSFDRRSEAGKNARRSPAYFVDAPGSPVVLEAGPCRLHGIRRDKCLQFLGIPYAHAGRFRYPVMADLPEGDFDATRPGETCPQTREYHEHLENPERMFYHKEFRDGITFRYDEDCLNLNIFCPADIPGGCHAPAYHTPAADRRQGNTAVFPEPDTSSTAVPLSNAPRQNSAGSSHGRGCPVIIYIYGGGFDSGSTYESAFDGAGYASRGIILVTIQYRVGILGYLTHEDIQAEYGHDGNFGLYDQLTAIEWVKKNISLFGGDKDRITLMGQSAGAISIQDLMVSPRCAGLFERAIMLSGGGLFPKFALPREAKHTRPYWKRLMQIVGAESLDALRDMDLQTIFDGIEVIKKERKDAIFNTMPVIDHALLPAGIDKLIRHPIVTDAILSYTNKDMYTYFLARTAMDYAAAHKAYTCFFNVNAPGADQPKAFHSSDLRFVFGTLDGSWRPYDERDRAVSEEMMDRFAAFAASGDPNTTNYETQWTITGGKSLWFTRIGSRMARPDWKLLWRNTL